MITAQVLYTRSRESAAVALGIGMVASSMGASRQLLGLMNQGGLSVSYNSITRATEVLGNESVGTAQKVVEGPHATCYDNFQTSTSNFVEQTANTRPKMQLGTFAVIYKLPASADPKHMRLADLQMREQQSRLLEIHDLRPKASSVKAYRYQTKVTIIGVLIQYVKGFESYAGVFKYKARRKHPEGHKNEFFPLRVSTIEEASIKGNNMVIDDIYPNQLKKDMAAVEEPLAVPSINDQLTNSRIRSVQLIRMPDVNWYEQHCFLKLAPAWFHGSMNGQFHVRHIHYGTLSEHGCLANCYAVLGKTRLGNAKPDYHTLEAANSQVLEGFILNAWALACGKKNLAAFAASKPTCDALWQMADNIITQYATPTAHHPSAGGRKCKVGLNGDVEVEDPVHENVVRLTRDLLLLKELVLAMRSGDIGRIEDILIELALFFRGAGANNYANELTFFAYNLNIVWTPEFADIMRDISLVNVSGLEGHAMGIDLNIEHLIGYLKALFAAKGIFGNWERCGNISASINNLMALKRRVTESLNLAYQGKTHTKADTKDLVLRMAEKASELKLQEIVAGRKAVLRPDLRALGLKKMASTGLNNFNKKVLSMRTGATVEVEEDEAPVPEFAEAEPINDILDYQGH